MMAIVTPYTVQGIISQLKGLEEKEKQLATMRSALFEQLGKLVKAQCETKKEN